MVSTSKNDIHKMHILIINIKNKQKSYYIF